jgi:hypothetical protein
MLREKKIRHAHVSLMSDDLDRADGGLSCGNDDPGFLWRTCGEGTCGEGMCGEGRAKVVLLQIQYFTCVTRSLVARKVTSAGRLDEGISLPIRYGKPSGGAAGQLKKNPQSNTECPVQGQYM